MIYHRRRVRNHLHSLENERLMALGRMSAGVSHEIKNPIGAIVLSAETALRIVDQPQSAERLRDCLKLIAEASQRCRNLVKSILSFSYGDGKARSFADVNELVQTAITYSRMSENGVQLDIETSLATDLPPILVNEVAIEIALVNLIQNAAQASPHDSPITLKTRCHRDGVEVAVIDEGVGIPRAQLAQIWKPGFTSRAASGGTGLGLPLVRDIVDSHNARITVESDTGCGSTFRIWFPIAVN